MQHYAIVQTFKNVKLSEKERLKSLMETRPTSVIVNCFLMCKQRASITFTLKEALRLWADFTPSWPFSEHYNFPPEVVLKICEVFQ